MITVEEADKIISLNIEKFPSVQVPLQDAFGMVLQEDLIADRDLPPFDRVTMDGIGIKFNTWEQGDRTFSVEGVQKAGIPPLKLEGSSTCLEVMTGAVLPGGCDCVIPYEDVSIKEGKAMVREDVKPIHRQFVHAQASDYPRGTVLLKKGARLLAPQVAIAASIGKAEVLVSAAPKVAAVGTGDEVVGINDQVEPHQIRQLNSYVIEAALKLSGYDQVTRFHLRDDKEELRARLGEMLEHFDVIVLSGGVSMGKFDYIPDVLAGLGVEVLFHQVKQCPGKPFWFGKSSDGKPVFALPGNPVSTQVGVYRYVLPYFNTASGACEQAQEFAVLDSDVDVKTDRTYFLPVKVRGDEDGRFLSTPVFTGTSGDYAALAGTDGFLELPQDTFRFSKGATARLYRWKN